jgi:type I restriction enzyme S subunit
MACGWKTVPLGSVLTFQRGFDITKEQQEPGSYAVISSSGPKSTHSQYMVEGPGVVIGRKGTLGSVFFSADAFWPHDTTLWIKDFHGNEARFAYYFLQTMGFERLDAGASNPTLNRNHIHTIPVKWPPLDEQRRIAGILSAYDDLIENCQRRIRILEEMARRLYREWFVHFRYPGHESIPLVDSPLGVVPQGWTVRPLGEVATVHRGRSYRSEELADEGGVPFLNLKCLDRDGGFRRSGIKCFNGKVKPEHWARKGDVVMAVTDMTQERRIVARAARVPTLDGGQAVFSMDLVRIEPVPGVDKDFLYAFLRFSGFADEVKNHANGANVLHLSPDRIRDYLAVWPASAPVNRAGTSFGAMFENIDTLENQAANLRRTRDLLLPKLLMPSEEINV